MPLNQARQKSSHLGKQSSNNSLKQTTNHDKNNRGNIVNIGSNINYNAKQIFNSNPATIPSKMSFGNRNPPGNHHHISDQDCPDDYHKIRLFNDLAARKNPFANLVKVSLLLNPREFELPEDYIPDIQFPGSSKRPASHHTTTSSAGVATASTSTSTTREARYTSYSVKKAQESDRSKLPLILRTCYVCRKGCRKAPLIHCDYCPLVYHADCIDPPLTMLPNTRWMCPNHVEPIAEEKLLTSSSFCERVKLWNHFSRPIDHESVKISFLDKVHVDSKNSNGTPIGDTDGRYVKLGCRVPRRIKIEYDKYIKEISRYNGDSDSEEGQEHVIST